MNRDDRPAGDAERVDRIRAIVDRALAEWEAGTPADPEAVIAANPDYMPELESQLRTAHTIFRARMDAAGSSQAHRLDEADDEAEELRALQPGLPDYELKNRLQRGGQGVVYRAFSKKTRRVVALKFLHEGAAGPASHRRRFAREIKVVSQLRHPNIVKILDSGSIGARPWFAMEYVEGQTIDNYFKLERPSTEAAVRMLVTICRAIDHAHDMGVIHRDLKPANILVDQDHAPHILDFGLAKVLDETSVSDLTAISLTGQVIGTLHYMSPEQVSGAADAVTRQSDIYALGLIIYRLLTGAFPYQVNGDPSLVRSNILHADPKRLHRATREADSVACILKDGGDEDLQNIIFKALDKEPQRRYDTAGDLADDLERYLAGEPVHAQGPGNLELLRKNARRYRLQLTFASILIAVMGVASVMVTFQWLTARRERDNARAVARLAHATFNDIVGEMEDSIRTLPGGNAVRDRLLDGVAERLDRLRELVQADEELEGLLLQIDEKRGDVAAAMSRPAEARRLFESCIALARKAELQPEQSDEALIDYRLAEMRSHRKLAALIEDDWSKRYEDATAIGRSLIAAHGPQDKLLFELTTALVRQAGQEYRLAKSDQAMACLREVESLGVIERSGERAGDNEQTGTRDDLAWAELVIEHLSVKGQTLADLAEGEAALESLQACLAMCEQLCERFPTHVGLRARMCDAQYNLAQVLRGSMRYKEAIDLLKKALTSREYLCQVEPESQEWKQQTGWTLVLLSEAFQNDRKFTAARGAATMALEIAEALSDEQGGALLNKKLREAAHTRLVADAFLFRKLEPLLKHATAAVEISRAMVAESESEASLESLARALQQLGMAARMHDWPETSYSAYHEAFDIQRRLYEKRPEMYRNMIRLVIGLNRLAVWELHIATPDGDAEAAKILDDTEALILRHQLDGTFTGHEEAMHAHLLGICENRALIERRKARRAQFVSIPAKSPP